MSRKKTPWDNLIKLSPLEMFIQKYYHEHYFLHHAHIDEEKLLKMISVSQYPFYIMEKVLNGKDIRKIKYKDFIVKIVINYLMF